MIDTEVRWMQRLQNFQKALLQLKKFIDKGTLNREGFRLGILANGELWMEMLHDRNRSSQTYNEQIAKEITANIRNIYCKTFEEMGSRMEQLMRK